MHPPVFMSDLSITQAVSLINLGMQRLAESYVMDHIRE